MNRYFFLVAFSLFFVFFNSCEDKTQTNDVCKETLSKGCALCCNEVSKLYTKFCPGDSTVVVYYTETGKKYVGPYSLNSLQRNADTFIAIATKYNGFVCTKF